MFEAALCAVAAQELDLPPSHASREELQARTETFFSRPIGWVRQRLDMTPALAAKINELREAAIVQLREWLDQFKALSDKLRAMARKVKPIDRGVKEPLGFEPDERLRERRVELGDAVRERQPPRRVRQQMHVRVRHEHELRVERLVRIAARVRVEPRGGGRVDRVGPGREYGISLSGCCY